jgi:hypothetical protein
LDNNLDISNAEEGMRIKYIGESSAFGGEYTAIAAESTYKNPSNCPDDDRGKLMIVEFMNDDTPMFFRIDKLNKTEWRIA